MGCGDISLLNVTCPALLIVQDPMSYAKILFEVELSDVLVVPI